MNLAVVLTTCGTEEAAEKISETLVREKLVACASITKVKSFFRWSGEQKAEEEFLVVMKTKKALLKKLEKRMKKIHSYELPEFLVLDASASADYSDWVSKETL